MIRYIVAASMMLAAVPASAVNIVSNPGFETGDFTGWTASTVSGTLVTSGAPLSGLYDARLRTTDNVTRTLSQVLPTVYGAYRLSYFMRNTGTLAGQDASIDALTVTSGGTVTVFGNRPAFVYQQFSQTFLATGPTTISFTYLHPSPGSFQLDDVSVTSVPEPTTWAMLVAGFALVGFSARRRKSAVAA